MQEVALYSARAFASINSHLIQAMPLNLNRTLRLLIIAGGPSVEHEVSLASARRVMEAASQIPKLEAKLLVVTKEGRWISQADDQNGQPDSVAVSDGSIILPRIAPTCDVIFPLIYDWNGHGGSSQLIAEMSNLAYIGSPPLANALLIDKPAAKIFASSIGIPQVRYSSFCREDYLNDPAEILQQFSNFVFPLFVKPSSLGSSVGITKVNSDGQLAAAIENAMRYDRRIIVEEGVRNVRELFIAVIGNRNPQVSPVAEITFEGDFYGYDMKYTKGGSQFHMPADIPVAIAEKAQSYALQAYRLFDCVGFARFDFFWDSKSKNLFFNEGTTNPGLTINSAFPKMVKGMGIEWVDFIADLVEIALERRGAQGK